MTETPPNDAARPVAVAVIGSNGCERNTFWVREDHFGGVIENGVDKAAEYANEYLVYANREYPGGSPHSLLPLYTAADYDALRAEVEKLRKELREQANFYVHPSWRERCEAETARAEAAEARIWKAETELNDWQADVEYARKSKLRTTYSIAAVQKMIDDFRAALNEGGE